MTLRFVWVWASLRLTLFRAPVRSQVQPRSSMRMLLLTTFAGVRGAITLAGILTLPLTMADGSAFPARDLVIFLAMGVILLSLLMASATLPLIASGVEFSPDTSSLRKEENARNAAAEAAIRRIEQIRDESPERGMEAQGRAEAAMRIIDRYRRRLDYGHASDDEIRHAKSVADAERNLKIEALRAERDELYRLRMSRQIDDPLHQQLVREIDLMEAALSRLPFS